MKILIVNPPSNDESINRDMAGGLGYSAGDGVVLAPLDLLNLATTLRNKHNEVLFVDAVAEKIKSIDYFNKLISVKSIEVVIGNLSLPTIDEDIEFFKSLKRKFGKIKIFIKTGINYPQILDNIIRVTKVNGIIFTECDLNIDKYITGEEKQGLVTYIKGKVKIFPVKDVLIENLDSLPIPARELTKINLYKYLLLPGTVTTMQTSRGCPYPCSYYCPYPLVQGSKWRFMTANRVVDEMLVIKKMGINNILFRDATFTLDMVRAKDICKLIIKKKLTINWWCETRINVLDDSLIKLMRQSGCKGINVGVETMSENLIVSQGKPGVTLKDVIRIRNTAKKNGVKLHFLMIVGLPNDNINGLYSTYKYLTKLKPESAGFSVITPYPGTKMFDQAIKEGLVSNFDWKNFKGNVSNMKTIFLTQREIEFGRYLLMITNNLLKRNFIFKNLGLLIINLIFIIWKLIKKE